MRGARVGAAAAAAYTAQTERDTAEELRKRVLSNLQRVRQGIRRLPPHEQYVACIDIVEYSIALLDQFKEKL